MDFDISRRDAEALYAKGYAAGREFEANWNWDDYLGQFRQHG